MASLHNLKNIELILPVIVVVSILMLFSERSFADQDQPGSNIQNAEAEQGNKPGQGLEIVLLQKDKKGAPAPSYRQAAMALSNEDYKKAARLYEGAVRDTPSVLQEHFQRVQEAFRMSNRLEGLVDLLNSIELNKHMESRPLLKLLNNYQYSDVPAPTILKLVKVLYNKCPEYRDLVVGHVFHKQLRSNQEYQEMLRGAFLPQASPGKNSWYGVRPNQLSYYDNGRIYNVVFALLNHLQRKKQLASFTESLEDNLRKHPEWNGGQAVLLMLYARQQQYAKCYELVELLKLSEGFYEQRQFLQSMAQEFAYKAPLHDDALTIYEYLARTAQPPDDDQDYEHKFKKMVLKHFIDFCIKTENQERALPTLAVLLSSATEKQTEEPRYTRYFLQSRIGKELKRLGYPFEAYLLRQKKIAENARPDNQESVRDRKNAERMHGSLRISAAKDFSTVTKEQFERALENYTYEQFIPQGYEHVPILVQMVLDSGFDSSGGLAVNNPFMDKVLSEKWDREVLEQLKTEIQNQSENLEDDSSTVIALALLGYACGEVSPEELQLEQINKQVSSLKPDGELLIAEQQKLISCWYLARIMHSSPDTQREAEQLAITIREKIREIKQTDWLPYLLTEQGELYLSREDSHSAQDVWSEVLTLLLNPPPKPEMKKKNQDGDLVFPEDDDPFFDGFDLINPFERAGRGKVVETENTIGRYRFRQIMTLSRLAAENEMPGLSYEAVTRSLKNGPLTYTDEEYDYASNLTRKRIGKNQYKNDSRKANKLALQLGMNLVRKSLTELTEIWEEKNYPLDQIYSTLFQVVFPEENKLFPYYPAINVVNDEVRFNPFPASNYTQVAKDEIEFKNIPTLAEMVIEYAVQTNQLDSLNQHLNRLVSESDEKFNSLLMLTISHYGSEEYAQGAKSLLELQEQLQEKNDLTSALHVLKFVIPILPVEESAQISTDTCEVAISNMIDIQEEEYAFTSMLEIARLYLKNHDKRAARRILRRYKDQHDKMSSVLDPDRVFQKNHSTIPIRKKERVRFISRQQLPIAELALKVDDLDLAFQFIGEFNDWSAERFKRVPDFEVIAAALHYKLATLPPEERYEILLNWVLTNIVFFDGSFIREVNSKVPTDFPSEEFRSVSSSRETTDASYPADLQTTFSMKYGYFNTTVMLLETARELNRLDEVRQRYKALDLARDKAALRFELLLDVATGNLERATSEITRIKEALDVRIPKLHPYKTGSKVVQDDYLLALVFLGIPELREQTIKLIELSNLLAFRSPDQSTLTHSSYLLMQKSLQDQQQTSVIQSPEIPFWSATSHVAATTNNKATIPSSWVMQNEHISHRAGPFEDYLYFAIPLEGEFEFSCESLNDRWSEGHLSYAGLTYQVEGRRQKGQVWSVGRYKNGVLHIPTLKHQQFNEMKIKVSPDNVQMFVNGMLFSENRSTGQANPWIALFSESSSSSCFRNIQLKGTPRIPDKINLLDPTGLTGWTGRFFNEKVEESFPDRQINDEGEIDEREVIWQLSDGILTGKRIQQSSQKKADQSYLYYHRPLRNADQINYEFFCTVDDHQVFPAIGRVAFVLEPDQVKLHWITDESLDHWDGLPVDNEISLTSPVDLQGELPLRLNDWNEIQVSLMNNRVTLTLNGTEIAQYMDTQTGPRHFGFFHYKDRSEARIRNVVLKGDWPQNLTAEQLLKMMIPGQELAKQTELSLPVVKSIVPEDLISSHTRDIMTQGRILAANESAERQYQFLKHWVVPNQEHDTFRLYPVSIFPKIHEQEYHDEPQVHGLKSSDAPVTDLLLCADQNGYLDDLIKEAESFSFDSPKQQVTQTGFLILAYLQKNKNKDVNSLVNLLMTQLGHVESSLFVWERWTELMVLKALAEQPEMNEKAKALLRVIDELPPPGDSFDYPKIRNPSVWHKLKSELKEQLLLE